jgi:hypothetical protein
MKITVDRKRPEIRHEMRGKRMAAIMKGLTLVRSCKVLITSKGMRFYPSERKKFGQL